MKKFLKIGQYVTKISVDYIGLLFWPTCIKLSHSTNLHQAAIFDSEKIFENWPVCDEDKCRLHWITFLANLYKALTQYKPPPSRHLEFCRKAYFVPKLLLSDCQVGEQLQSCYSKWKIFLTAVLTVNFDPDVSIK